MARNRMIKVDFWGDEKIAKLSLEARLIAIGFLNFSDDFGVIKSNIYWLKSQIFLCDGNITVKKMTKWVEELKKVEYIKEFTAENSEKYFYICKFRKHQRVDKPNFTNKNPEPPPEIVGDDSENGSRMVDDEVHLKEKNRNKEKKSKNLLTV